MARRKDPKKLAEKYVQRATAATQDMIDGINAVSVNPAEKAIKAIPKMRANFLAALDSGQYEEAMKGVTLDSWKTAMIEKGVPRVAQGVRSAQPKMEAFFSQQAAYQEKIDAQLAKMPTTTLEDNIARMTQQVRMMGQFKYKK